MPWASWAEFDLRFEAKDPAPNPRCTKTSQVQEAKIGTEIDASLVQKMFPDFLA